MNVKKNDSTQNIPLAVLCEKLIYALQIPTTWPLLRAPALRSSHVAEAIQYRSLDRQLI
jgi:hypothetical protein